MRRTPLAAKKGLARGINQLARTELPRASGRETRNRKPRTRTRPTSDAPFRAEVMAAYGEVCRVCGATGWVQAAHIMAKSQGGPSLVWNGMPLCEPDHTAYDGYRLKLRREHLTNEQAAWLEEYGYIAWDDDGQPYGRGARRFAPLTDRQIAGRAEKGGQHDD